MMIARTEVEQGYVVPAHRHENEQITGDERHLAFHLEGRTVDVGPNEMIVPSNLCTRPKRSRRQFDIFRRCARIGSTATVPRQHADAVGGVGDDR